MSLRAVLFALLYIGLTGPVVPAGGQSARLLKVNDGDTIEVRLGDEKTKIRLYGIDAPEKDQPGGKKALRFLKSLLTKNLTVNIIKTDRYKRLIAFVTNGKGKNVNYRMVEAGWAWWYKRYYKSSKMARLESQARDQKRGVWAGKNPKPPWLFRAWNRRLPKLPEEFKARIVYTEPGRFYLNYKGAAVICTTGPTPRKNCNWPKIRQTLLFEGVRVKGAHYRRARFIRGTVSYQGIHLGRFLKLEGLCD